MSKKKNNHLLLLIFGILLLAVGVTQLVKMKKGERTFRKDIITIEANEITKIASFPKKSGNRQVDIYLDDTIWKLKFGGKVFPADQELIKQIVDELANMKPEQLVANKRELWKDYDITDSLGTKLMVYGQKKEKTEITVGRFSYNPTTRKPSTYIRVDNDEDVYSVEGYIGMVFNREINSLRDKNIFRGNKNDVTQIAFSYPSDSSFTLSKTGSAWMLNGVAVDSARMAGYLGTVTYLTGSDFRDDFEPSQVSNETFKVTLSGPSMKPVEIKAFMDAKGVVIQSNENPESFFTADQGQLVERIYKGRSYFSGAR